MDLTADWPARAAPVTRSTHFLLPPSHYQEPVRGAGDS